MIKNLNIPHTVKLRSEFRAHELVYKRNMLWLKRL